MGLLEQATSTQHSGVRTQHKDYVAHSAQWQRCRDVMAGQDAVHQGGTAYLPKLKEQAPEDYKAYVLRAPFYNASWRTVSGLVGMMYRKPPKQEIPKGKIQGYLDDVSLSGVPFTRFSQAVSTEVLEVGRIGLLVDHPLAPSKSDGTPLTVAEAEQVGLRPTMQRYTAETIINWKYRNIANQQKLCMVVLKERAELPGADEFGVTTEDRYRVLDLTDANVYRVRIFRINDKTGNDEQVGPDIIPLMNGMPLDFIPFVFIRPDGTDSVVEEPPLIDLVDLNLAHYRVTADYEHACHFLGTPTPWIAGFSQQVDKAGNPEKLYVGSQSAWIFADPQAKCGYLEFNGSGMQTLRLNLDAKKQEMATLGARMLADTSIRQVETFGATAIKHTAENSILSAIAISVSEGLTIALKWFCQWAGADPASVTYDLNRDFLPVQMDAQTLTALMQAWQAGALSEPELFDLFKRGDLIESDKALEDHQAEIDNYEAPDPENLPGKKPAPVIVPAPANDPAKTPQKQPAPSK